jgi:hypothetical protein
MHKRTELQALLEKILENGNVYFQPPESIKIKFPCIVYEIDNIDIKFANDDKYLKNKKYTLTYIDKNPDNETVDKILSLKYCSYNRRFISDNLYHDVFTIYF